MCVCVCELTGVSALVCMCESGGNYVTVSVLPGLQGWCRWGGGPGGVEEASKRVHE